MVSYFPLGAVGSTSYINLFYFVFSFIRLALDAKMKFRTSFQISRPATEDGAKEGARPGTSRHFKMPSLLERSPNDNGAKDGTRPGTSRHFKMSSLLERPSIANLTNRASQQKAEVPKYELSNGSVQKKAGAPNGSLPNLSTLPNEEAKNTPTRIAMQEFLQKTGANIKSTGAKLERRIPRRKSQKIV